jgi:short-subunit dehydrogenase
LSASASDGPFEGKVVVITGASSGLGASLAEAFAAAGATPVLFARSAAGLAEVADRCRSAGASPLVVAGDVTVADDCAALARKTLDAHGRIDLVVACAGIGMWADFQELHHPEILHRIMQVNYGGLVNTVFHTLPCLKQSRGLLVAVSSIQGAVGVPYHTGYAASKHAVQGFCNSLRMELRGSGVDILTVMAHWISGTRLREQALGGDGRPRGKQSHRHGAGAVPVAEMTGAILRAAARRERIMFMPGKLRALAWLAAVAPALADRIIIGKVEGEASRKV